MLFARAFFQISEETERGRRLAPPEPAARPLVPLPESRVAITHSFCSGETENLASLSVGVAPVTRIIAQVGVWLRRLAPGQLFNVFLVRFGRSLERFLGITVQEMFRNASRLCHVPADGVQFLGLLQRFDFVLRLCQLRLKSFFLRKFLLLGSVHFRLKFLQ